RNLGANNPRESRTSRRVNKRPMARPTEVRDDRTSSEPSIGKAAIGKAAIGKAGIEKAATGKAAGPARDGAVRPPTVPDTTHGSGPDTVDEGGVPGGLGACRHPASPAEPDCAYRTCSERSRAHRNSPRSDISNRDISNCDI